MMWSAITSNSHSSLVFVQRMLNSNMYIPIYLEHGLAILLSFLKQESIVLFQQDNSHPHNALQDGQQFSTIARLVPWDTMEQCPTLSIRSSTSLAALYQ